MKNQVIALAGNPNTGKSTIFNALTGLKQHTGNWSGKTVLKAEGNYEHNGISYTIIDLPGTYSLMAHSTDEQVARDFICFEHPDVTVVVVDATSMERNLNLALQVMEITPNVIICLNLIDEATRKGIRIDRKGLSKQLGVPIIATSARKKIGLDELKDTITAVCKGQLKPQPIQLSYEHKIETALQELVPKLIDLLPSHLNPRWVALRLLSGDFGIVEEIQKRGTKSDSIHHSKILGEESFSCHM